MKNKWLRFARGVAVLIVLGVVAVPMATGNGFFDDLYLWQPHLQPILIIATLFALPYYLRYLWQIVKS